MNAVNTLMQQMVLLKIVHKLLKIWCECECCNMQNFVLIFTCHLITNKILLKSVHCLDYNCIELELV